MKLRHPRNNLTQYKDEEPPKRSFSSYLTQWLYLAAIFIILGFIGYYIIHSIYYFNQRGMVLVNHIVISSARGGRILSQPVQVGQHVKKGDLLLRVASPNTCKKSLNDKKMADLKMQNSLNAMKMKMLIKNRTYKEKQLQKIRYQRSLELFSKSQMDAQSLQDELQNLSANIQLLRHGKVIRRQAIKDLAAIMLEDRDCMDEFVYAPENGTIVAVEHKVFEVLQRTEPCMDFIATDADVYIEAAFHNKYYNAVSMGEDVKIRLPDGELSQGVIKEIKSTSAPFAVQENNRYLQQRTRLLVVVKPANQQEAKRWKPFIEMEVEVRGWQ